MPHLRPGDDEFGEHNVIVTRIQLEDFRKKILEEMAAHPELYHPKDVQRISENDDLCRRYVRHKDLDIPAALTWAKHSLRWRKQSGINDATEEGFPIEFFHHGTLVPYNTDKFGSHVLTLRVKLHRKDSSMVEEMRKYFAFFMDKIMFEKDALRVTVVFDCTDAGVSNVDMELVKFVVMIFKELYPWALGKCCLEALPLRPPLVSEKRSYRRDKTTSVRGARFYVCIHTASALTPRHCRVPRRGLSNWKDDRLQIKHGVEGRHATILRRGALGSGVICNLDEKQSYICMYTAGHDVYIARCFRYTKASERPSRGKTIKVNVLKEKKERKEETEILRQITCDITGPSEIGRAIVHSCSKRNKKEKKNIREKRNRK
ncbi:uncharacterized protein [Dermacentor andersoni]|uniref:uncharacterized protein isoform X1 n=1 Tax=Dermacentor andersoni TaxID=34620 RepID=UPI002415D02F|nr:uncharacterized protein LOC126541490 isoform X1 [Dermacentor andersoni]